MLGEVGWLVVVCFGRVGCLNNLHLSVGLVFWCDGCGVVSWVGFLVWWMWRGGLGEEGVSPSI